MCGERLQSLAIALPPSSGSLREAVGDPLAGLVSFAAGIVQLAYAPWPLAARIAVFACLGLFGVFLLVRFARGRAAIEAAADQSAPTPPWRPEDLAGVRVVTFRNDGNGQVAQAELRSDRGVRAQPLPLSHHQAYSYVHRESGSWHLDGDELAIAASNRGLTLRPTMMEGIWAGVERNGSGPDPLLAAIVDPRPLRTGQPWTGLKLGEMGQRRIVVAEGNGRLTEIDLIVPGLTREASWAAAEHLHVHFGDGWSLVAEPTLPAGIMLGSERAPGQRADGFALVRVRLGP